MNGREEINTLILPALITKQHADHFVSQLDDLLHSLYNAKSNFEKDIDLYLSYDKKELLMNVFKKDQINLEDKTQLQQELTAIKNAISSMPLVTFHLAFVPSAQFLEKVANWLIAQNKIYALIDILYDPSLLGGVVVEANGMYKDFSIRKKLEEFFTKDIVSNR